ncbi:MAG: hypothetical protein BMS9Abin32_748 [Gammaproteobacteria bacterium]|nr:MAG: hypothetical protein BMS9Abin32_748 [Gammaproteobacteria bacterium]
MQQIGHYPCWRLACAATLAALLALAAPASGAAAAAEDSLEQAFGQDVLIIEANRYACYRFDVYLAVTYAQRRRGLMRVRQLPQFSGMLFAYRDEDMRSMWMKNTYIALDILFIRGDGTVSSVIAATEPLSLHSLSSTEPVRFVLELNAGVSERLHIGAGSRLLLDRPAP